MGSLPPAPPGKSPSPHARWPFKALSGGFIPRRGDTCSFCSHSRPGKQNRGINLPGALSPLPPQKPSWYLREKGPGLRGQDMGSDWLGAGLTVGVHSDPSWRLSLPSRSAPRPQSRDPQRRQTDTASGAISPERRALGRPGAPRSTLTFCVSAQLSAQPSDPCPGRPGKSSLQTESRERH